MQNQRIINWQQQALEIMGVALLRNRTNMSYNLITPTEMIIRCREDNWKVIMTEKGLFHLYHNNYVIVNQTERKFFDEYHDQNVESANLEDIIKYIAGYSWDEHLRRKGIEVDRTIFKFRIMEDGEISKSKVLKRNELDEYIFVPFRNRIRFITGFGEKYERIKKLIINILPNGKESEYEFICAVDEEMKKIYIAEGVFNAQWKNIRGKNVDVSLMHVGNKKASISRKYVIQYSGISELETGTQALINRRMTAIKDDNLQYVISDMDDLVHHKSCEMVEHIKYWEFDALDYYPERRKVCPKCRKLVEDAWRKEQLGDEYIKEEDKDMALLYNETIYDNRKNDWLQIASGHMDFYSNIRQYISNLKLEQEKLEREIEELLEFMEENNCNAAQGFKLYKFLRERRVRRKEIIKELELLEAWVETFDCQKMIEMYQESIAKMQEITEKQSRKCTVHNFFEEAS